MFQIVKFKDAYTPICMYVCTHAYININAWSKEKHLRVWNPPIIGPLSEICETYICIVHWALF